MNKNDIRKTLGYFPDELNGVNLRTKQGQEHARDFIADILRARATKRRIAWQERVKSIDSDSKRDNLHNLPQEQHRFIYNSGYLWLCGGNNSIKIPNGYHGYDFSRFGGPVYIVHNKVDAPNYYNDTCIQLSGKFTFNGSDFTVESDNISIYTAGYSFIVCLNDREPDRNRNPWIIEGDPDYPRARVNMFSDEYAFLWKHSVNRFKRISKSDIGNYEVFSMGLDDYYLWEYEQGKFIVFGPGKMAGDSNERLEAIFAK